MKKTWVPAIFLQDDPRFNRQEAWPAGQFPEASYRYFREAGCLVCALAMMLLRCGAEPDDHEEHFNPWKLNERLIGCGAFSPAADLDLRRVERLYPIRYCGSVPYSREALEQFVKEGRACLIAVPGTLGPRHFLCLDRLTEGDAVVIDPKRGTTLLSRYSHVIEIRSFSILSDLKA